MNRVLFLVYLLIVVSFTQFRPHAFHFLLVHHSLYLANSSHLCISKKKKSVDFAYKLELHFIGYRNLNSKLIFSLTFANIVPLSAVSIVAVAESGVQWILFPL